jgi:hypothetical protein
MPSNPVVVRRRRSLLARGDDLVHAVAGPVLRILGLVTGACAFGAAGLALVVTTDAGALLTAAGGLGALAFGTVQAYTLVQGGEAANMKARAVARLARRSLVEMVNHVQGILMVAWIADIGAAKSLDPVQALLRELVDVTAPVGGWRAAAAERAFGCFLLAADRINGLHARRPPQGDFGGRDVASKGRILGFLIATVDALLEIAPAAADERAVKAEVKAMAESIEKWFGPLLAEDE